MEVLHFHQLISVRSYLFPDAAPFETTRKHLQSCFWYTSNQGLLEDAFFEIQEECDTIYAMGNDVSIQWEMWEWYVIM
jgi:hypothetical protein